MSIEQDKHGHRWFGRVCTQCGINSDSHERHYPCRRERDTSAADTWTPVPTWTPDFSAPSVPDTAPSIDTSPTVDTFSNDAFSGGESGGGGGGSDF